MSADNIAPTDAAGGGFHEEKVGYATGKENAQGSAWRLVTGAPKWIAAVYRPRYGGLFDARQFGQMFLDGSNTVLFDCRDVRRDTDIGPWNRQ